MKRDSASGDGISLTYIDAKGYHPYDQDQIEKIKAELKL